MSLKRKSDQLDASPTPTSFNKEDGSPSALSHVTGETIKYIKTEQLLHRSSSKSLVYASHSPPNDPPERECFRLTCRAEEREFFLTDEQTSNGSSLSPIDQCNGDRDESKIPHDESITPTPPTDEDNHPPPAPPPAQEQPSATSTPPADPSLSEVKATTSNTSDLNQPQRKPRKNVPSSKLKRPSVVTNSIKVEQNVPTVPSIPVSNTTTASPTISNSSMIFNLIRSLLEEKKAEQNDENLISTIDCLIDSLQHLRDRIKSIDNHNGDHENHYSSTGMIIDESSPLNLSKPKARHQTRLASNNSDDTSPTTTTVSSPSPSTPTLPLASALFPPQSLFYEKPFFPPFTGTSELRLSFQWLFHLSVISAQHDASTELLQDVGCFGSE
jgi:hypothetical protein